MWGFIVRTFNLDVQAQLKAVVPECFIQKMRTEAQDPVTTTPFLTSAQEMHPGDDDAFILMVLCNGLKLTTRHSIIELFEQSGLGCTISPVTLRKREFPAQAPVLTGRK